MDLYIQIVIACVTICVISLWKRVRTRRSGRESDEAGLGDRDLSVAGSNPKAELKGSEGRRGKKCDEANEDSRPKRMESPRTNMYNPQNRETECTTDSSPDKESFSDSDARDDEDKSQMKEVAEKPASEVIVALPVHAAEEKITEMEASTVGSAKQSKATGNGSRKSQTKGGQAIFDLPSSTMKSRTEGIATPIKLLKKAANGKLRIDLQTLENILKNEKIKSTMPISVISIAGALRNGKSFFLNLLLKYLRHQRWPDKNAGWNLTDGIQWKSGPKGHTDGIDIWSEPLIVKKSDGTEIAVLLADTQGNFDHKRDKNESVSVFALSTLFSTVQVFNVSKQVQTNDLEYLQCFAEYARASAQSRSDGVDHIPFQTLIFLVRDWPSPNTFEYGIEGGKKYLKEGFFSEDVHDTTTKDYFQGCFQRLACYLMPMPSPKVMVVDSDKRLKFSDIGKDFHKYAGIFAKEFLNADKLQPKTICGVPANADMLMKYMRECARMLESDDLPNIPTLMESMTAANNATAIAEAEQDFENRMNTALEELSTWEEYDKTKNEAKSDVESVFRRKTMYGGRAARPEFQDTMENLSQIFEIEMSEKRAVIIGLRLEDWKKTHENEFNVNIKLAFFSEQRLQKSYREGLKALINLDVTIRDHTVFGDFRRIMEKFSESYYKALGRKVHIDRGVKTAAMLGTGAITVVAGTVMAPEITIGTISGVAFTVFTGLHALLRRG